MMNLTSRRSVSKQRRIFCSRETVLKDLTLSFFFLGYGHLMIMADQDSDGSHIKGLVINMIHSKY